MHDLDRTSLETNGYDYEEAYEYDEEMDDEYDYEFDEEYDEELDDEYDYELDDEYDEEMDDEYDYEFDEEYDEELDDEYDYELDDEYDYEGSGSPFTPEEEAELAFELLSISSPEEEQEFLRKWGRALKRGAKAIGRGVKRVAKKVSRSRVFNYARRRIQKRIMGILRRRIRMIKRLAPYIGGAVGGPVGAKLGSSLSGYASKTFKMELEGLSPEDQEFEIAKRWVRLSGVAAKHALKNAGRMPVEKAIRIGFTKAARRHAPGLLEPKGKRRRSKRRSRKRLAHMRNNPSGRWYRKGNKIVLMGLR